MIEKDEDDDNIVNEKNSEHDNVEDSNSNNTTQKKDLKETENTEKSNHLLNEKENKLISVDSEKLMDQILQISKDLNKINLPEKIHCPECGSNIFIRMIDISTFEIEINCSTCKSKKNMKLKDFISELIKVEPQKCSLCQKNESLYKCQCGENICENCKNIHLENVDEDLHNMINFSEADYTCACSEMEFNNYCTECNKNLCYECLEDHSDKHPKSVINILNELPSNNELKQKIDQLEKQKETIDKFIKILDDWTNEFLKRIYEYKLNLTYYYKLNEKIQKNYDVNKINYESLQNLKNMSYNFDVSLVEFLVESSNENNWKREGFYILQLLDKLTEKKKDDKNKNKKENKKNKEDENDIIKTKTKLTENAKKSIDFYKKAIKSVCLLKKKKLLAVGLNKKINFYDINEFNEYSNLNEKSEIIELTEMENGNLLICANGYFKIFKNNDENNGGNEIQFQNCKNIKKIIESKNGYLICLCDNPNEKNGIIRFYNYDSVNKNYKEDKEVIKLDNKPSHYLFEMNYNVFCIYLQNGILNFYENDSTGKKNYQKKFSEKDTNLSNINSSKLFKINDDVVAITDPKTMMLVSVQRNTLTYNSKFKFCWENIYVLSNGKILASIFYDNNEYYMIELAYDKTKQAIRIINYYLFDKPKNKFISSILELSDNRLITYAKDDSIIKIWDIISTK